MDTKVYAYHIQSYHIMIKNNVSGDFLPRLSSCETDKLDEESVLAVRNILIKQPVKVDIDEGGTRANIDGTIDLLDEESRIIGKLTVQVKHLTYSGNLKGVYYDIPQYILGYADRIKGELVVFMACDYDNSSVYWKYIDSTFIRECRNRADGIQGHYRYYFKETELLNKEKAPSVITEWKRLYQQKKMSIKDIFAENEEYASLHKQAFNDINTGFFNIRDSHIERKETEILLDWVKSDLKKDEPIVKLLVGKAGVGKSVVIRDFIHKLDKEGIKCLAIKADRTNITCDETNGLSLQSLQQTIDWLSSEQKKVVLIIDQIDALSQYLSNDRSKLSNLLTIVNTLRENQLKDVRIVVSCREFDLQYDADLKLLNAKSSFLKLGELSTDEVKGILSKLEKTFPDKISVQTLKLLSTPQYLDIFSLVSTKKVRHVQIG